MTGPEPVPLENAIPVLWVRWNRSVQMTSIVAVVEVRRPPTAW